MQTMIEGFLKACGAGFVAAYGDQKLRRDRPGAPQGLQVSGSAQCGATAKLMCRFVVRVVDERDCSVLPHRPCDIEYYLAMPAGAP
jgi:hypothetical protein